MKVNNDCGRLQNVVGIMDKEFKVLFSNVK